MQLFIHGLFHDEEHAARAVQALIDAHFDPSQVSALVRLQSKVEEDAPTYKVKLVSGAVLGTLLGMIGGPLVLSAGFLIAGPLAAAAEGALAGAVAGAVGGLAHWKDEIDLPKHLGKGAAILVGVVTGEPDVERAQRALAEADPEKIHVSNKDVALKEIQTGVLA